MRIMESRVRNAGGLLIMVVVLLLFCSSNSGVQARSCIYETISSSGSSSSGAEADNSAQESSSSSSSVEEDNSVQESSSSSSGVEADVNMEESSSSSSADEKYEKYKKAAAELLYGSVHHNYLAKIRPPDYFPEPVPVHVTIILMHIRALKVMKKELEAVVDMKISWPDKRLAWNNDDVTNITKQLHEVWLPPVVLLNAAEASKPLFNPKVVIIKGGIVTWQNRYIVTLVCKSTDLHVRGTQQCDVSLGFTSPETMEYAFSDAWGFFVDPNFSNHRWHIPSYRQQRKHFQRIDVMLKLVYKMQKKNIENTPTTTAPTKKPLPLPTSFA